MTGATGATGASGVNGVNGANGVNGLFAGIDRWLLCPAPAERLAAFRVLVGAFATVYLAVRFVAFRALADNDASSFDPVGILWWLRAPLSDRLWIAALIATLVAGVAFTAGARFRVSGPTFAVLLLTITTYRSSWGQLLHFENLLVLHALVVGCSRSADAWSLDARRTDKRAGAHTRYGWPLRLAACVSVATYVLAGVAKLRYGGTAWITGDSLRHHVAYSAVRLQLLGGDPSPLAGPLVEHGWLFRPAAAITVVLELAAPLALIGRRWRTGWVTGTWLLHAGIAATMFVVFPYPLSLIAFAPLFDLERGVAAAGSRFSRYRTPVAECMAVPVAGARRR